MTRKVLAVTEGTKLPDDRLLDLGSLYIDDADADRVPVTWAHDSAPFAPIGWAHGFERILHDNHADLSVDLIFNDQNVQDALDHFEVYPFVTELYDEEWRVGATRIMARIHRDDPPQRIIKKARIRVFQLVPIVGFPIGIPTVRPVERTES